MNDCERLEWVPYYPSPWTDLSFAGYTIYADSDYRIYTRASYRGTTYRIALNGEWCSEILPSLVAVDEWFLSGMEAE